MPGLLIDDQHQCPQLSVGIACGLPQQGFASATDRLASEFERRLKVQNEAQQIGNCLSAGFRSQKMFRIWDGYCGCIPPTCLDTFRYFRILLDTI